MHTPSANTGAVATTATPTSYMLWFLAPDIADASLWGVRIEYSETVDQLRRAIYHEMQNSLTSIDAGQLALWKVEIPYTEESESKTLAQLTENGTKLRAFEILSEVFVQDPEPEHIHIVVQLPSIEGHKRTRSRIPTPSARTQVKRARRAIMDLYPPRDPADCDPRVYFAPSDERPKNLPPLFFNRPCGASGTPVTLLDPILAKFVDDCCQHIPTDEDALFAMELSLTMSRTYAQEQFRAEAFRECFYKFTGITLIAGTIEGTQYSTDGHLFENRRYSLITDCKNELGNGKGDAGLQGGLYYLEAMRHIAEPDSVHPCLLIYYCGSFLGIAGMVYTDCVQQDVLTHMMPLHWHPTDVKMQTNFMQTAGALKKAVVALREFYKNPGPVPAKDFRPDEALPYRTFYKGGGGKTIRFVYGKWLNPYSYIYHCTTTEGPPDICVKFTQTYSREAHEHCAKKRVAPQLLAFEELPAGWKMVVMEWLAPPYKVLREDSVSIGNLESIKSAVVDLHEAGMVHGDLRVFNVMAKVDEPDSIKLIDFDWAGKTGEAKYPALVNRKDIWQPAGVKNLGLITKQHDLEMIENMGRPAIGS